MKISKKNGSDGADAYDLVIEVTRLFFAMRQIGQNMQVVTPGGAGSWGLLRSLKEGGPQTVPQLAKARPVSRQHIQKLTNELASQGLVAFIPNPGHKSSLLIELTKDGEKAFDAMDRRVRAKIAEISSDLTPERIKDTGRILRSLRERMLTGTQRRTKPDAPVAVSKSKKPKKT